MPEQILIFFLILTNAGGEGKTTLAKLILAIFNLAGVESYALDADQGNRALKSQFGDDEHIDTIGWDPGQSAAERIVIKADMKPALMDSGANMLVAYSPISDVVIELQQRFAAAGYRTVVLFPLSPNKSGGAVGINRLADKIQNYEKIVVLNHRDLSGRFGDVREDLPSFHVQHLQSGLQAYMEDRRRSLAEVILNPEPGYVIAAGLIGNWVRQFAQEPVVRDLLTKRVCDAAIERLPPAPRATTFRLETIDHVTDTCISTCENKSVIVRLLHKHTWSALGLRAAADELDATQE